MDKEVLETFCKISKNISIAKGIVANSNINRIEYIEARQMLDDCLELMAIKADTAPINLISGRILNG